MSLTNDERFAIVSYRLEKAEMTLDDATKSAEYGMYNTAANRLYYAFYYAASALLIDKGLKVQTHSGLMSMLHLHFLKAGKMTTDDGVLMRRLFALRQEGDYEDFVRLESEDVVPLLPETKKLICKIRTFIETDRNTNKIY